MVPVVVGIVALVVGIAVGFLIRKTIAASNAQSIEARAQKSMLEAEREADATRVQAIQQAREEAATIRRETEEDVRARREEVTRLERRMAESEADLRKQASERGGEGIGARRARREAAVRARAAGEGDRAAPRPARAHRAA